MKARGKRNSCNTGVRSFWTYFTGNYDMYLMLLLPIAFYFTFKYVPIYGLVLAFKN